MYADLQTRKINFVQDFLRLESEESLQHLEEALHKERLNVFEKTIAKAMTSEELHYSN